MDDERASTKQSHRVSWVPFGLHQQHPNNYKDIFDAVWENRDNLGYAYRILRDGCSLGTTGMHDWTMKDVHLCWVRLQLLRLNTMPAMNWHLLEDVAPLRRLKGKALRNLGRLCVPMIRRRGDQGFWRVSWDEAISLIAERIRQADPHRLGWFLTSCAANGSSCTLGKNACGWSKKGLALSVRIPAARRGRNCGPADRIRRG
jgi:hypothetical protein